MPFSNVKLDKTSCQYSDIYVIQRITRGTKCFNFDPEFPIKKKDKLYCSKLLIQCYQIHPDEVQGWFVRLVVNLWHF